MITYMTPNFGLCIFTDILTFISFMNKKAGFHFTSTGSLFTSLNIPLVWSIDIVLRYMKYDP